MENDNKIVDFKKYKEKKSETFEEMDDDTIQMNEITRNISVDLYLIRGKLKRRLLEDVPQFFSTVEKNLEGLKNYPDHYKKIESRYQELREDYQKLLDNKRTI